MGFVVGFHTCAGCSPQATFEPGTSSVRSAPNASTFWPQRLSGLVGFEPHTGCRAAAVGKSALAGADAWPGFVSGLVGQK